MGRLAGLCALLLMSGAVASDKLEVGPVPAWVKTTPLPADHGPASDAATRFLLADWQFRFSQSGDEGYFNNVVRVDTPQGLAALGTLSLPWNPATSTLTVHRVHIIRAGQVIDVLANGQSFTVLRRENSLEYATLNGVLTAVLQPAGLQVGDTLDLAYSIVRSDPVLAGTSEWIVTAPNVPLAHLRLRAIWAAPTHVHWRANDLMTGLKETHHQDISEVSAALDDVQPLVLPASAPSRFRIGRQVQFSSFSSWSELANRLAPLYAHAATLAPQSPLQGELARIRAAGADRASRALAALALVQDQVRYVYLGMNDGALIPADADLTWTRRFGDCKGKTALLLALLHALDIEAQPVAVNLVAGDSVGPALPMVEAFNHVLVRANIDGKDYWLDGTGSGARSLDDLISPPYYWGLPLVAGGELLPIAPAMLKHPTGEITVHIDASAGIPGPEPLKGEFAVRGAAAALMRLGLANMAPGDREQMLRKIWTESLPDLTIHSVSATYDEPTATEHINVDGSLYLEWSTGRLKVPGVNFQAASEFARATGPHSDAPFVVKFPVYIRMLETISLPAPSAVFTLEGGDLKRSPAGIEFLRTASIENGVLTVTASTRSTVPEIQIADLDKAKSELREVAEAEVYLRQPDANRDVIVSHKPASASVVTPARTVGELIARGNLAMDEGDFNRAVLEYDRALQIDARNAMALADRGLAYAHKGEPVIAQQDLDAAAALDPRNPVVPRARGLLAGRSGNYDQAIKDFTASLALEPNNTFSLYWRAVAYERTGAHELALADTSTAVRVNPADRWAHVLRAELLRDAGRPQESGREADALIAANPDSAEAYAAAADIYMATGKDTEGMSALQRALALTPSARGYVARADYRPATDLAGRREDLDAALKLDPLDPSALQALAQLQADSGQFAEAVATLDKVMAAKGESEDLLTLRATIHARSQHAALADQDVAAVRAKATTADSLNNLCYDLAKAGVELDAALSACDAAVALAPTDAAILDSRAFVLLRLQRYQESIAVYDTALKLVPTEAMSLYGRGIARHRMGDTAGGDKDLQAAQVLDARTAARFDSYGIHP